MLTLRTLLLKVSIRVHTLRTLLLKVSARAHTMSNAVTQGERTCAHVEQRCFAWVGGRASTSRSTVSRGGRRVLGRTTARLARISPRVRRIADRLRCHEQAREGGPHSLAPGSAPCALTYAPHRNRAAACWFGRSRGDRVRCLDLRGRRCRTAWRETKGLIAATKISSRKRVRRQQWTGR